MAQNMSMLLLIVIPIVLLLLCFIFPSQMKKEYKKHFRYYIQDTKMFRTTLSEVNYISSDKDKNNPTKGANIDLVTFPIFDDDEKIVGKIQILATLLKNENGTTDITQDINYIFTDGLIHMRAFYRNGDDTIYPSKETTIPTPIVSGDGVYKDAKGYVNVRINKDGSRDVWINYSI